MWLLTHLNLWIATYLIIYFIVTQLVALRISFKIIVLENHSFPATLQQLLNRRIQFYLLRLIDFRLQYFLMRLDLLFFLNITLPQRLQLLLQRLYRLLVLPVLQGLLQFQVDHQFLDFFYFKLDLIAMFARLHQFWLDGREGKLNHYSTVAQHANFASVVFTSLNVKRGLKEYTAFCYTEFAVAEPTKFTHFILFLQLNITKVTVFVRNIVLYSIRQLKYLMVFFNLKLFAADTELVLQQFNLCNLLVDVLNLNWFFKLLDFVKIHH